MFSSDVKSIDEREHRCDWRADRKLTFCSAPGIEVTPTDFDGIVECSTQSARFFLYPSTGSGAPLIGLAAI